MDFGSVLSLIEGGGAAAQVATAFLIYLTNRTLRDQGKRIARIERHIWPQVFGEDPPD